MTDRYIHRISRRTALQAAGASLTLPFLPSLAWAQNEKSGTDSERPPRRLAVLLFANGVNEAHWWQKTDTEGRVIELSKTLVPLEPLVDDLLFLNNLHLFDDTQGTHTPYFTNFLTGKEITSGAIPNLAESLDQMAARTVGKAAPVPSIALGIESAGYGLSGGRPAIYNGTISWSSPTTPVAPEIFPRQAFDRLFDTTALLRDKSVLDFVAGQARSIRTRLDSYDQHKLDEYLGSIREIEQRIQRATAEERLEGWRPTLDEPNIDRPPEGRPQDIPEHVKLMLDILVLALRMDKTRVATMVFQKDVTGMQFGFLDGVGNSGMHTISHHRRRPETLEEYQRINQFHVEHLVYVLNKMKAVDEGHGTTLLDNTMLVFSSTMMDGDTHDANKLPLILCGGRAAGIRGGRSIQFDKLEDRRLCNLHLALAQRMGCSIDQFGNSHHPLPGLDG